MLAHPRADDGVLVRRLAVELLNDSLRGDIPFAVLIGEGVLFFPAVNHAEPFRSAGVDGGFALPAFCGQSGVEHPEGVLHVCADGIRHLLVFIDLAGVDINVNDRGFRTEHIDGACHAVVKPGAQGNNQIRFIHGVIRKHGSVHAQPTQGKRVGFRHGANAHQGGRHRNLGTFRKFQKIPGSFRRNDAAAGVNDRPPGVFNQRDEFFQLVRRDGQHGVVAGNIHLHVKVRCKHGLLHVLGHVNQHRARTARRGDVEGFLDDTGQFFRFRHQIAVLHDRGGHAEYVCFLEGAASNQGAHDLSRNRHQRRGVQISIRNGGNHVGGAGAGGGNANAHLARNAAIAFRAECPALFMAGQDGPYLGLMAQGLMNRHAGAARIGKDDVYTFTHEAFHEHFSSCHAGFRRGG